MNCGICHKSIKKGTPIWSNHKGYYHVRCVAKHPGKIKIALLVIM